MTDTWDFYFSRVNDVLSSIAVNMSARATAPDPARPQLLWVWIPMRAPRPDGLSSADEAPTLGEIEDALTALLAEQVNAVQVGRVTGDARREFYFYAPHEAPLDTLVSTVLARHPGYTASSGQQHDAEWSQYLGFLYPSPRELQRMQNRQVVMALAEAGDVAEQSRDIDHWAYFATIDERDAGARQLASAGFEITEQSTSDAAAARPHGLRFRHRGPATQDAVDEATWRVLEALEGVDAEYDGWESPVIKAAAPKGFFGRLFGAGG